MIRKSMRFTALLSMVTLALAGCRYEPSARLDTTTAAPVTETAAAPVPQVAQTPFPRLGAKMPQFDVATLEGETVTLGATGGKVVLYNLWATWCGPCRHEMPMLESLHREFKDRGFEVVGVSVDTVPREEVIHFVQANGMTFPVRYDPDGKSMVLFQTSFLPTSALVDRQGNLVWFQRGMILPGDNALADAIRSVL